jgi:hypothetical protein
MRRSRPGPSERPLEPALAILRELAQYSAFAELIERRRKLLEQEAADDSRHAKRS